MQIRGEKEVVLPDQKNIYNFLKLFLDISSLKSYGLHASTNVIIRCL